MFHYPRRDFLQKTSTLMLLPWATSQAYASASTANRLAPKTLIAIEQSARGFNQPLRLPGNDGLFAPLPVSALTAMRVVATSIKIIRNQSTPFWAYVVESGGKTYLNPTLIGRRGERVKFTLHNTLAQPTIIHWHGLHNDTHNDGNMTLSIPQHGQFNYDFEIRDRASLYWYHPHTHGYLPEQVNNGLAALMLVGDEEEDRLRAHFGLKIGESEFPLVIQDRSFNESGHLLYPQNDQNTLMGFIGEKILVNLTAEPLLPVPSRWVRWRVLNGSNARTYQLAFIHAGQLLPFYLIGADGGLLASPLRIDRSFIAPAQRLDILIDLSTVRSPITLASLPFDPMHNEALPTSPAMDHGTMDHSAHGSASPAPMMDHRQHGDMSHAMHSAPNAEGGAYPILRLVPRHEGKPSAKINIPSTLSTLPPAVQGTVRTFKLAQGKNNDWTINGKVFNMNEFVFDVKKGSHEIWEIENDAVSMPHPMHIHGVVFRVLKRQHSPQQVRALAGMDGLLPQDRGLLDTIHIWPGERVRLAIDFTLPFAGDQDYVFHCHNLEHGESMMVRYRVLA